MAPIALLSLLAGQPPLRRLPCSLPCLQGRVGVGSLFASSINLFAAWTLRVR